METDKIVERINNGEIIIMPTDTTYGIICDALNVEAVKKVYLAKKRSFNKPLLIIVSDYEMLKKYAKVITPLEEEIILKYSPGPLTILIAKNELISDVVTSSSPLVAIRIPDNNFLREIIKKVDKPLIATSANISESKVITSINEIEEELRENIDAIYDGGTLKDIPSTLIKVEKDHLKILRDGLLGDKIRKDYHNIILP